MKAVSEKIANFILNLSYNDIPKLAFDKAKSSILDYIGVSVAGASANSTKIVQNVIKTLGGNRQASVWGRGFKTSTMLAAIANGTAAHSLDFDDSSPVMRSHPSVQMLPGLFAIAEWQKCKGMDILTGYLAGFEIGAKLSRAMLPNMITKGWFPVGIVGPMMQAAACSKILKLNLKQIQFALGISTNLSSGLRCNNSSMVKPFMAGHVGATGIMAALLAQEGLTSNIKAIESSYGFFENFCRGDIQNLEKNLDTLGKKIEIMESGLTIKPYASVGPTHMPVDCILEIKNQAEIDFDRIKEIKISIGESLKVSLYTQTPNSDDEARHSLEYCVARALLDGCLGPKQFSNNKLNDKVLKNLMDKVRVAYYKDKDLTLKGIRGPSDVTITLDTGQHYTARTEHAKGSPKNPLSWSEIEEKFNICCQESLGFKEIENLKKSVKNFENLSNISNIISNLVNY
jgi:2-methylcitrate dehydratase PrpD